MRCIRPVGVLAIAMMLGSHLVASFGWAQALAGRGAGLEESSEETSGDYGRESRAVLVTFERRVGPFFAGIPGSYGSFLTRQREAVLDLLFEGTEPLARPGDAVFLFADGIESAFARELRLPGDASPTQVGRELERMIDLPADGARRFWMTHWEGSKSAVRQRVDEAIQMWITCPLVGTKGPCLEKNRRPGRGVRDFSRPRLTLPVKLQLLHRAFEDEGLPPPVALHWIWIQSGVRFNEINSVSAEIYRDFQGSTAPAVERYRVSELASLDIDFVHGDRSEADPGLGGLTLWRISSGALRRFADIEQLDPVRLERFDGHRWVHWTDGRVGPASLYRTADSFLPSQQTRVRLISSARADVGLVSVSGQAICWRGLERLEPVPLKAEVETSQTDAMLDGPSQARLDALARACLPLQGLFARLKRELSRGDDRAQLQVLVHARLAPKGPGQPALLAQTEVLLTWQHTYLRPIEWLLHVGVASLFLVSIFGAFRVSRYLWGPASVDLDLVSDRGERLGIDNRLALAPGEAGSVGLLLLVTPRIGFPPRGRYHATLRAKGLQSELPLRAVGTSKDAIVLRPVGSEANRNRPLTAEAFGRPGIRRELFEDFRLELYVSDDILNVGVMPVEQSLRAGIEIDLSLDADAPRIPRAIERTIYLPCDVTVRRAQPQAPQVCFLARQVFQFRGLRPRAKGEDLQGPVWVGVVRIDHAAAPGSGARPFPVRLDLEAEATFHAPGSKPLPVVLQLGGGAVGESGRLLACEIDRPRTEVVVGLFAPEVDVGGEVAIDVRGRWSEIHEDRDADWQTLESTQECLPCFPADELIGIALDFGTSATRLALLRENRPLHHTRGLAVPKDLILDPALTGELESFVSIRPDGSLRAAGSRAFLEIEGWTMVNSLKEALMDSDADEILWRACRDIVSRLAALVEVPRSDGGEFLHFCHWEDGQWDIQEQAGGEPFRYLLLITVPDTFSPAQTKRFIECFDAWQGRVAVQPLREAEAVVFGSLISEHGEHPERVLVVDVGAGTVDFAAVLARYDSRQEIEEIRIDALAVSRYAGNEYDKEVVSVLHPQLGMNPRRLRAFKNANFVEPEVEGSTMTAEKQEWCEAPVLTEHMRKAIHLPLRQLQARLTRQDAWSTQRFDRVVLTGRGSLALGWKPRLVEEVRALGLVAGDEATWLRWARAPSISLTAERLKASVVRGALALVGAHQARIQTSQDVLRDHLLILYQAGPTRYGAELILPAGTFLPAQGLRLEAEIGDWFHAHLVYSSHPPADRVSSNGLMPELLWRRSVPAFQNEDEESEDEWPEMTWLGEISPATRPTVDAALVVKVARGGTVRWSWDSFAPGSSRQELRE